MSHTPEPWEVEVYKNDNGRAAFTIFQANMPREEAPVIAARNEWKNGEADGLRIEACVNACAGMADPAAELTRLRQIEADARAANLIGLDGKVRRVLGTLPVTRDGFIVGQGATVWDVAAKYAYYDITLASPHNRSYCVPNIPFCSSTPEAAEAAKENK